MDVIEFLNYKNIVYKTESGKYGPEAIITCPHCGKEKLSININSGKMQCWVCQAEHSNTSPFAKSHISVLMKQHGEILDDIKPVTSTKKEPKEDKEISKLVSRYHHALKKSKQGRRYLYSRGFSDEDIDNFQFGFLEMKEESWISIPCFKDGVPKLLKYRKITNNTDTDKYQREAGCPSIFFNQDALDRFDEVFITEGELDAATLIKNGYENTVGITVGAGGISNLIENCYDDFLVIDKIYLVFDPDGPGQKGARDVWATRLGISKCWNVVLPDGNDVNDFFKHSDSEDFDELVSNAHQFKVSGIISLEETFDEMYLRSLDGDESESFRLPWQSVNTLLGGGLKRQRLLVVGGIPGSGKTSLTFQILWHLAREYNIPSLYFCMEMPEVSLAVKAVQLHYDLHIDEVVYGDALIYKTEIGNVPIYFGYSSKVKPKIFYNTMEEVRNRYGIQIGVFDNLQRLVRTGEESDMGQASGIFKDITMDMNMPFILVSQPRKLNKDRNPTIDDLKGSGAIPADADHVLLLYRKRCSSNDGSTSSLEPETKVIADKSRFSSGGSVLLYFKGGKSKFEEIE